MKSFLSVAVLAMTLAVPALAQTQPSAAQDSYRQRIAEIQRQIDALPGGGMNDRERLERAKDQVEAEAHRAGVMIDSRTATR